VVVRPELLITVQLAMPANGAAWNMHMQEHLGTARGGRAPMWMFTLWIRRQRLHFWMVTGLAITDHLVNRRMVKCPSSHCRNNRGETHHDVHTPYALPQHQQLTNAACSWLVNYDVQPSSQDHSSTQTYQPMIFLIHAHLTLALLPMHCPGSPASHYMSRGRPCPQQ
jgi:hypothetical protein